MLNQELPEIQFAIEAVRKACEVASRVQTKLAGQALTKEDRSPVTVADFAVQALIASMLKKAFPKDSLVAEEDSATLRGAEEAVMLDQIGFFLSDYFPQASHENLCGLIDIGNGSCEKRFWTLDPIDGTKGFLRGEQYAIALALLVDGQVQLGVLGCPNLSFQNRKGILVIANRGEGAWYAPLDQISDWKPIGVSEHRDMSEAVLLRSVEKSHTNVEQTTQLMSKMGMKKEPVLMDSLAKYAMIAGGEADILFRFLSAKRPNYREKIWDQAAGQVILEEAGGKVTDLEGKPLDFRHGRTLEANRGIVASNGHLHEGALEVVRSFMQAK